MIIWLRFTPWREKIDDLKNKTHQVLLFHNRKLIYLKGFDEVSDAISHVTDLQKHLFKDEEIEIILTVSSMLAEKILREMKEGECLEYIR